MHSTIFTLNIYTRKIDDIIDGRRSFPSGHSSAAWAGMTFLFLFFAGHTAALCFSAPSNPGSLSASRLLRLSVTIAPLFWSTWVAVSRIEDYVSSFFIYSPLFDTHLKAQTFIRGTTKKTSLLAVLLALFPPSSLTLCTGPTRLSFVASSPDVQEPPASYTLATDPLKRMMTMNSRVSNRN
jgi:hypothetical protein